MATVSVIVPVYRVEQYIGRCVNSILRQTFSDFELILVDDGSPDRCGAMCDVFAQKDPRIKVIHQENGGLSAARNAGIDFVLGNSDSKYITFVDSDDWVEPNYLFELMQGFSLGADVACIGYVNVSEDGVKYSQYPDEGWKLLSPEDYWVGNDTCAQSTAWGKLYRKDFFNGVRYPIGKLMEDAFTTHQLVFRAKKVAAREVPLYNYFTGSQSIMRSDWSIRKLDAVDAFLSQRDFFQKNGYRRAKSLAWQMAVSVMSGSISHLEKVDKTKAHEYRAQITCAMANGELPFWDNRLVYRNMHVRFFAVRWFVGMVGNALTKGRRSWLAREATPIAKLLLQKARKIFSRTAA